MSNAHLYRARAANAYRTLTRPPRAVGGLGCNCSSNQLRGYRVSRPVGRVGRYEVRRAVRASLQGLNANAPDQVVLIPVSDRRAIENAVKYFGAARAQMHGLGVESSQVQSTASMAATGAKLGSIVPGIGTVIGAVIGAAVGYFLSSRKPPPRASAAQKQECVTYLSEYMAATNENPNSPIPLDEAALKQTNWCLQALYGGSDIRNLDPRYFDGNFVDLMAIAKDCVLKIYNTPVGGVVNIADTANKIGKQTFRSTGLQFANPPFTDLKTFTRDVFTRLALEHCKQTAGKGAGGCEKFYSHPEYQRLFYDMLGYAARTLLPNISEADLQAASVIAQQTGTSAHDVVTAVETVIKRNVQRDETAALLAPSSGSPLPITPVRSASLPTAMSPPPTPMSTLPTTPLVPSSTSPSFFAPPSSSMWGASSLAPLAPLTPVGLPGSALTTQAVAASTVATPWYQNYWLLGGGVAAILAGLLLRKSRGTRR